VQVRTKRVYAPPEPADGRRILVDRLWPRGLSKAAARLDYWAKTVAPSAALRRWYGHAPAKWDEFRRRYRAELEANAVGVAELRGQLGTGTVTFLYGSKEARLNNATALREYLTHPDGGGGRRFPPGSPVPCDHPPPIGAS
jgi:uncharacterized protein YeaO (DUF488 family)